MKKLLSILVCLLLVAGCVTANAATQKGITGIQEYFSSSIMEVDVAVYTGSPTAQVKYKASIDGSEFVELSDVAVTPLDNRNLGVIIVADASEPYINAENSNDPRAHWITWANCHYPILHTVLGNLPNDIQVKIIIANNDSAMLESEWMSTALAESFIAKQACSKSYKSNIREAISRALNIANSDPQTGEPEFCHVVCLINPGSMTNDRELAAELPYNTNDVPLFMITYHQNVVEKANAYERREKILMQVNPFAYLQKYSDGNYTEVQHDGREETSVDASFAASRVREWMAQRAWNTIDLSIDLLPMADYGRNSHEVVLRTIIGRSVNDQILNVPVLPSR